MAEQNTTPTESIDLTSPALYLNRELSLLEFQRRVLEEAWDEANPLLERVKFLSIFGSNMDEFFMVRVSGIRKMVEARIMDVSPDGMVPPDELAAIRKLSQELMVEAQRCYQRKLLPQLEKADVHIIDYQKLNKTQKERVDTYFREVIYPVLTPLALDPGHPFPHISNLSLNLAIVIHDKKGNEKFARLKVPDTLPRLLPIKRSSGGVRKDGSIPHQHYFVWLEQVIAANLEGLFPGMQVTSAHPFRIVRDADIEIQELEADDLLETMQQNIRKRKFGSVVQVAVYESMPQNIRELLVDNLEVSHNDVYVLDSPLGLSSLWQLYSNVERHDLKDVPYKPRTPEAVETCNHRSGYFRNHPQRKYPHSSSLRFLQPRRGLPQRRGARPAGACHQADPVPRRLECARGRSPARSGGTRQAGGGAGGVESPLRRRVEHRLGEGAGRSGRACGLWTGRFEDPLQGDDGRPPGGRGHPPLPAPGNGKLQRADLAHLRRHRALHL